MSTEQQTPAVHDVTRALQEKVLSLQAELANSSRAMTLPLGWAIVPVAADHVMKESAHTRLAHDKTFVASFIWDEMLRNAPPPPELTVLSSTTWMSTEELWLLLGGAPLNQAPTRQQVKALISEVLEKASRA